MRASNGLNEAGLKAQAPGAQIERGVGERSGNKGEFIDGWRLNVSRGQSGRHDEKRREIGTIPSLPQLLGRGGYRSGGRDSTAGGTTKIQSVCLSGSGLPGSARRVRSIRTAVARRHDFPAGQRGYHRSEQAHQQNRQGNDVAQDS